jgi:hypothetical protein
MKVMELLLRGEAIGGDRNDATDNGIEVAQDFGRWNAHYPKATQCEPAVSPSIAYRTIAKFVRTAIDLDDQSRGMAIEVRHERAGGMLLAKFQTSGALAQRHPQSDLGWRHRLPKRFRAFQRIACALQHHPILP